MKHTLGPLAVTQKAFSLQITDSEDTGICEFWRRGNPEKELATAKLMAAAPDLLEALEMLAAVDFGANGSVERGALLARIAIDKATGAQHAN